ncbi:MAG TPA: methyltransferase domain-containing protein [Steroidobacteraceae bacterium]|nr:methyltransferase domain-containing protein [Steroidobacteraceae bacterium]
MRFGPVARGLLSYVPALNDVLPSKTGGHTDSASYCYGVWMKHLTLLHAHGFPAVPQTIAELGPGESLGVGLCALLSGSNHYVGLDVIAHSNPASNQAILNDLIPLFRDRAPNPDKGWPEFSSYLDERLFPSHVLTEQALQEALSPERIEAIRRAVTAPSPRDSITAEYKAPWFDPRVIEEGSVDLVVSQSVLEHVVDLPATYKALHQWVRPGGWMSHQIDFKSHGLSTRWNGYRTCSDRLWEITLGKRPFMINRQPASVHLRLIQEAGFHVVTHQKFMRKDGIRREELAPRWADMTDEDLNCSGMYVIATKS